MVFLILVVCVLVRFQTAQCPQFPFVVGEPKLSKPFANAIHSIIHSFIHSQVSYSLADLSIRRLTYQSIDRIDSKSPV